MQYLKHAPSFCKTCTIPHLELLTCSITDFYKRTRIGLIPKVSTINLVTDCKLQLDPIGLPSSSSMSSVLTCLANASTCRSGVNLIEAFNAVFALIVEFWPFYVWTEIPLQMQTDNSTSVIHILNLVCIDFFVCDAFYTPPTCSHHISEWRLTTIIEMRLDDHHSTWSKWLIRVLWVPSYHSTVRIPVVYDFVLPQSLSQIMLACLVHLGLPGQACYTTLDHDLACFSDGHVNDITKLWVVL